MASIERVVCVWTGATALPGASVFYGSPGVPTLASDLYTFFDAIKAILPSSVSITIPSAGDMIEDSDGALSGTWSSSGTGTVVGTNAASYAAGVGARIVWRTNGVRNRRRVRGSTFICPLTTNVYEPNGTLTASALTTLGNAATAVAAGGNLVIWSRPSPGGGTDGDSNAVLNASVPDRVTALRSRRY